MRRQELLIALGLRMFAVDVDFCKACDKMVKAHPEMSAQEAVRHMSAARDGAKRVGSLNIGKEGNPIIQMTGGFSTSLDRTNPMMDTNGNPLLNPRQGQSPQQDNNQPQGKK